MQQQRPPGWWMYIITGLGVILFITLIIVSNKAGLDVPYGTILMALVIGLAFRLVFHGFFRER